MHTALFGAAASQPTTSLFGAAAPQQPTLFGAAPTGPASFTAPPLQPDFSAVRELVAVRDAFVPDSERFRFQSLFLNVVPNPAARVKPSGVDDLRWREALQRCGGADNADSLWPVAARGFEDLVSRKDAQVGARITPIRWIGWFVGGTLLMHYMMVCFLLFFVGCVEARCFRL